MNDQNGTTRRCFTQSFNFVVVLQRKQGMSQKHTQHGEVFGRLDAISNELWIYNYFEVTVYKLCFNGGLLEM